MNDRSRLPITAISRFPEFVRDLLAPLGRVTMRCMFGKTGIFCDGVMFGMISEEIVYFRVDDQNEGNFEEARAFPPLNYKKRGSTIDLGFWRVPDRLFDEQEELVAWARNALAAAHRVAAKKDLPCQGKRSSRRV